MDCSVRTRAKQVTNVAVPRWWFFELPGGAGLLPASEAQAWIDGVNFRLGVEGFQEAFCDHDLVIDGRLGPDTIDAVRVVRERRGMLTANFHVGEWTCTHCGRVRANREAVRLAQRIRDRLGRSLGKDSTYRCEDHPLSRKNPSSHHIGGCAYDPAPDIPVALARECGASGIGFAAADNSRCTHFDVGHASRRNPEQRSGRPGKPQLFVDN